MISLEDCEAMCGLSKEEIDAISEHEHLPEIAAAALGNYLLHLSRGPEAIRSMLVDDIRAALKDGNHRHAADLFAALRHFLAQHPCPPVKNGPSVSALF